MTKRTLEAALTTALFLLLFKSVNSVQAGTDERLQALRSLDSALEASVEENEPQNDSNQNPDSKQASAEANSEKSHLVQACDREAVFSWHPDVRAGRINTSGIKFADINTAAAIKACRTASEQFPDHARSFSNLGRALAAAGDFSGSMNAFRRAAEMKDLYAYFAIGYAYEYGEGVEKSQTEAVRWYRKAANLGLAVGQFNLGKMYQNGKGVVRNSTQALKSYLGAAEQGHTVAQYKLGLMYARGEGVDKNGIEAIKWYRNAAEAGHAVAQHNLGVEYSTGRFVSKDYLKAFKWYREAAQQGYASSMDNLGVFHEFGIGVDRDPLRAAEFYFAALKAGSDWVIGTEKSRWKPETARELQLLLQEAGFYNGSIDGRVGSGTKSAMRALLVRGR